MKYGFMVPLSREMVEDVESTDLDHLLASRLQRKMDADGWRRLADPVWDQSTDHWDYFTRNMVIFRAIVPVQRDRPLAKRTARQRFRQIRASRRWERPALPKPWKLAR